MTMAHTRTNPGQRFLCISNLESVYVCVEWILMKLGRHDPFHPFSPQRILNVVLLVGGGGGGGGGGKNYNFLLKKP